ncbi:MAG: TonB-dependent receptor [Hyphomicrobiales bacterium]
MKNTATQFIHHARLLGTVCLATLALDLSSAGAAQTYNVVAGANSEAQSADDGMAGAYSISVDGEVVAGSAKLADRQRKQDRRLDATDIQVKFDGLDAKPALNVSTAPARQSYGAGEPVDFLSYSNYPDWITSGEVRIFEQGANVRSNPLAIVPLQGQGVARWSMPANGAGAYFYVLRVYDAKGRYDETAPLSLRRGDAQQHAPQDAAVAPGYAEDRTALRNIPVYGGSVTVFGSSADPSGSVEVMGQLVPVDAEGKFVSQRILPPGDHDVDIHVKDAKGKGLAFDRQINIPSSEWFYVALADLTLGKRYGNSAMKAADPGEFDNIYSKGHLAFYLKGKIKGQTLLTASADTGEGPLKGLLKGMDGKDPREFLKRIDPERYYPVYGDDSTSVEDAPTRGKFYVRLERGDSKVMWGNFKTEINGTQFMRNERALYGADLVYKSPETAPDGGRRTTAQLYAAAPGTLMQRDLMRGTGGSAYFLKQQDITAGSETVSIEVREATSHVVLSRRTLKYGVDYTINYTQGVIILTQALPSSAANGAIVSSGEGGNPNFLAVTYEYTPATTDVKGYATGGRAQQWFGDHLRVGATAASEKTGDADQRAGGVDIRLQASEDTFIEAEMARSKGPGFGHAVSTDGGLNIDDVATTGAAGKQADAYRVQGKVDLGDLTQGGRKGWISGRYAHKQGGFSSLDEEVSQTRDDWGAGFAFDLGSDAQLAGDYTASRDVSGTRQDEVEAHGDLNLADLLTLSPGVRYSNKQPGSATAEHGQRLDAGARLTHSTDDRHATYIFGQGTAQRDGNRRRNDRIGLGNKMPVSEKADIASEISYGTGGIGGSATLDYKPTEDDSYSIGYSLDPERQFESGNVLEGDDLGKFIFGTRHAYSKELSMFAEDSYDLFGVKRTLAQTYGVNYTPDARWSYGGSIELGHIVDGGIDSVSGLPRSDFDRKAFSTTVAYKGESGDAARLKAEARFDRSDDDTRDLNAYLLSGLWEKRANPDWRMLVNVDAAFTAATQSVRDGKYVEASLGYAYRPLDNDRLDALFRYTFLYDLPGIDQVTASGSTSGPQQISHILSADANFDVNHILTVGGKYGFRIGESRARDGSGDWLKNTAHLGVVRADLNIVHDWDALAEARLLWQPGLDSSQLGILVAGYRHFGDNFKLGAGYNFGRFSDDLRDQTMDDHGFFVNAVGQW